MAEKVLITDIQRFSVNDGPGFRTNVYLKGCMMRCQWCHNPETIAAHPELYWKRHLCVQCGACLQACPRDAIRPPIPAAQAQQEGSTYYKVDRDRCDFCMKCVDACLYEALEIVGKPMTIGEILAEVEQDRPFYDNSGGGMTLTGGEPTLHAGFARMLIEGAKERGLHVCLDTNGCCDWQVLKTITEQVDIVLFDLKHVDPVLHKQWTGVSNELILENLGLLSETAKEIWVRIPVVPNYNDSIDLHNRTSYLLSRFGRGIVRVDLLPFHNWCQDKYRWLGRDWPLREVESLEPVFLEIPADIYRSRGFETTVGGSGFEDRAFQNEQREK
jgi:pyruvate formate lyase activating enzyme